MAIGDAGFMESAIALQAEADRKRKATVN